MNEPEPLYEAGVYYFWPRGNNSTPPWGYFAYEFRRWKDGRDMGVETVYIMSPHIAELFKLLEHWSRKGGKTYSYTVVLPAV